MNEYFKLTVKPAGTNASEFVNHYSKYYYGETPEGGVPAILLGLNSSNHDIEEIVDDLLIKGLSDPRYNQQA